MCPLLERAIEEGISFLKKADKTEQEREKEKYLPIKERGEICAQGSLLEKKRALKNASTAKNSAEKGGNISFLGVGH